MNVTDLPGAGQRFEAKAKPRVQLGGTNTKAKGVPPPQPATVARDREDLSWAKEAKKEFFLFVFFSVKRNVGVAKECCSPLLPMGSGSRR